MEDSDFCDFCDLPRSQCIHGRPPPAPAKKPASTTPKPKPRKRAAPKTTTTTTRATRRWTPPEVLKPLIISVLEEAGGELEAEDAFARLEALLEDRMLAGDQELTPAGELRWQYAARRARVELQAEGAMTKTRPGVWQLG